MLLLEGLSGWQRWRAPRRHCVLARPPCHARAAVPMVRRGTRPSRAGRICRRAGRSFALRRWGGRGEGNSADRDFVKSAAKHITDSGHTTYEYALQSERDRDRQRGERERRDYTRERDLKMTSRDVLYITCHGQPGSVRHPQINQQTDSTRTHDHGLTRARRCTYARALHLQGHQRSARTELTSDEELASLSASPVVETSPPSPRASSTVARRCP